jgi:hypothetical protein
MDAVVEGARVRTAKGHGTVLARRGMVVRVDHDGGGVSWVQLSECQVVPPNRDSPHTQSDNTPQAATTTAASSQVGSLCALQLIRSESSRLISTPGIFFACSLNRVHASELAAC